MEPEGIPRFVPIHTCGFLCGWQVSSGALIVNFTISIESYSRYWKFILSFYVYIYVHTYMYICIWIHIQLHVCNARETATKARRMYRALQTRKHYPGLFRCSSESPSNPTFLWALEPKCIYFSISSTFILSFRFQFNSYSLKQWQINWSLADLTQVETPTDWLILWDLYHPADHAGVWVAWWYFLSSFSTKEMTCMGKQRNARHSHIVSCRWLVNQFMLLSINSGHVLDKTWRSQPGWWPEHSVLISLLTHKGDTGFTTSPNCRLSFSYAFATKGLFSTALYTVLPSQFISRSARSHGQSPDW